MSEGQFHPPAEPGYRAAGGPSGPRASFGRRFAAYLIDVLLLAVLYLIAAAIFEQGVANLIDLLLGLAYFAYFEGSASGQTIGKRALGIRVIDFSHGGPIGRGRALGRYLARILSALPIFLGYFWMLWDRERQTWHDKLVTSIVVPTSAYPVSDWPG